MFPDNRIFDFVNIVVRKNTFSSKDIKYFDFITSNIRVDFLQNGKDGWNTDCPEYSHISLTTCSWTPLCQRNSNYGNCRCIRTRLSWNSCIVFSSVLAMTYVSISSNVSNPFLNICTSYYKRLWQDTGIFFGSFLFKLHSLLYALAPDDKMSSQMVMVTNFFLWMTYHM